MRQRSKIVLGGLAALLWSSLPVPAQGGPGGGGNGGNGGGPSTRLASYLASLPLESVSARERADLLHMIQEEKLARDVYRVLAQTWSVPVHANIAQSEQEHMDLVAAMLLRYGIPNPLPNDRVGSYADPLFTQLFVMLTDFGRLSPLHAEITGALIEEIDILDLDVVLIGSDNRDLDTVWQNLLRGSRNHLRSFAGLIENRGIAYPGIFLPNPRVVAILSTPRETQPVDENGNPLP